MKIHQLQNLQTDAMDQTETDDARKDPKKWELMCATTGGIVAT